MPLLTRLYTPTHFASVNLFAQVVAGVAISLTWRLEYLVMLPKNEHQAGLMLRFLASMGSILAIIATILAWMAGERLAELLGDAGLAPWLPLAPLSAWLFCMSIGLQQAVQRSVDFRNSGLSEISGKAGYIASALIGSVWLPSVGGLLMGATFGAAAKCLWLWHALPRSVGTKVNSIKALLNEGAKPYLRLAASTTFANSLALVSGTAPLIYMAKAYGYENLGQFTLVVSTLYLPSSLLGSAIGQVYYQRAAQLHAVGLSFYPLWRATAWQLTKVGIPLYLGIAILSPWAYPLLFGDQWNAAGQYGRLMAIAAGMSFITSPLDRTSLVVQSWWYQIAWNVARTFSILTVIWLAETFSWDIWQYLGAIVCQMCAMYLTDWIFGMQFALAKSQPAIRYGK